MDPRLPLGLTEARMAMDRGANIEAALAAGLAAMDAAQGSRPDAADEASALVPEAATAVAPEFVGTGGART